MSMPHGIILLGANGSGKYPASLKAHMYKWDGEAFIEALLLSPDKSVLEIGVGTGIYIVAE